MCTGIIKLPPLRTELSDVARGFQLAPLTLFGPLLCNYGNANIVTSQHKQTNNYNQMTENIGQIGF